MDLRTLEVVDGCQKALHFIAFYNFFVPLIKKQPTLKDFGLSMRILKCSGEDMFHTFAAINCIMLTLNLIQTNGKSLFCDRLAI